MLGESSSGLELFPKYLVGADLPGAELAHSEARVMYAELEVCSLQIKSLERSTSELGSGLDSENTICAAAIFKAYSKQEQIEI